MADNGSQIEGKIVQVVGAVVDVEFPSGQLPEIQHAITVASAADVSAGRDGGEGMVLEVQQHISGSVVRTIAMESTDGLRRGQRATATGAPITVPVGEATLGRIFNVTGRPIDERGRLPPIPAIPSIAAPRSSPSR